MLKLLSDRLNLHLRYGYFYIILPSEHVCSDVYDHQGEPGIDNTPDREGPAGWSDVCLIADRHITCRGMEWTWKTTEKLNTDVGREGLALSLPSRSSRRSLLGLSQASEVLPNRKTNFFTEQGLSC